MRYTGRCACGSDDLLHRHDLRVVETNPSMAQPLGRTELFGAGADERMPDSDFLIRLWSARYAGIALLTSIVVLGAWWMKEAVLASDRHYLGAEYCSECYLPRQPRPSAHIEAPRTEENYLLKEMGFRIARKHRRRLRRIARLAGFSGCPLLRARQWPDARGNGRRDRGWARRGERGTRSRRRALALFRRSKTRSSFVLWCRCGLIEPDKKAQGRILIDGGMEEGL